MPGRGRRCSDTAELFAWAPPEIVRRYPEERVRTASLRAKIARAVSETLRDCGLDRETVALQMADWLGEEVTKNMLDAYASEARESHTIPYLRLLAIVHVTGDRRLLQLGEELFGCSSVEDRYLEWVEIGELSELKDEISKQLDARRRSARRGGQR